MKVISGEPICNSPLNHSKSKFMYSFGKAQRFPPINRGYTGNLFYNLPSMKTNRSTSIGYGTKSDFTIGAKLKCPVFYNYKSDFDQKNPRSPRYTFGVGRDHMYLGFDNCSPGPARYNTLRPFGRDGIKYSIGLNIRRTASLGNIFTPGPGAYNTITEINPNGTYFMSKNENVHSVEFSKDKTERFNYHNEVTPGPSDYRKTSMFGKIFDSRFKSSNGITIKKRFKIVDSRIGYPGPGAYKFFSEFGIYEKDDSKKNRNGNNNNNKSKTSIMNNNDKEENSDEKGQMETIF